jgi:hypothetical protein
MIMKSEKEHSPKLNIQLSNMEPHFGAHGVNHNRAVVQHLWTGTSNIFMC